MAHLNEYNLTILSSKGDGLKTFLNTICKSDNHDKLVIQDKKGNGSNTFKLHLNQQDKIQQSIGIILFFDTTSIDSYQQAIQKYQQIADCIDKQKCNVFMVGNKIDLEDFRQIQFHDANKFAVENGLFCMQVSSQKKDGIEYFLNFLKSRTALTIKKIQKQASLQNVQNGEEGVSCTPKNETQSLVELQLKEQNSQSNVIPEILRERSKTPPSIIEENLKKKQEFEQKQAQGLKNLIQNVLQPSLKSQTSSEINIHKAQEKEGNLNKQLSSQNSLLADNQISQIGQQESNEQTPNKSKMQKNSKDILEENILVYSFNNPNQELGFLSFKKDLNNQNQSNKLENMQKSKIENNIQQQEQNTISEAIASDQDQNKQQNELKGTFSPNPNPIQTSQIQNQKDEIVQNQDNQQHQIEINKLNLNEDSLNMKQNNIADIKIDTQLNQKIPIQQQDQNVNQSNQFQEEASKKVVLEASQNLKQDNLLKQKEEIPQKQQRKSNLNKIDELQKNLKRLKELEKSKANKSRVDSSLSQNSNASIPLIESVQKVQNVPKPIAQLETNDQQHSQTNESNNIQESNKLIQKSQNSQISDQNDQHLLQHNNKEIQQNSNQDAQNSKYIKQNINQNQNVQKLQDLETNSLSNKSIQNSITNIQPSQNQIAIADNQLGTDLQNQSQINRQQNFQDNKNQNNNLNQGQIQHVNNTNNGLRSDNQQSYNEHQLNANLVENNLQVPKHKESNNMNTDSTGTFGNKNSIYSISITNASIDNRKQQAQNMMQSEVIQEQTPIFSHQNAQNDSSKYSNGQYGSLNQLSSNSQKDSNKYNRQKNNMIGSFERKLVDENDNYTPTNYQKLAPVRESYDKDPKIPSLMVQSYLTNCHGDDENEDERYRQSKSDLSNLKSEIIRKPLQLEQMNINDKNSRSNTQRQLEDLDNQIKQIIQGDGNQSTTQQNMNDEDDSEFFSDIKFAGDKMLQTKEKVVVNPDILYTEKKKENNIRFTQSTFNQSNEEDQINQKNQSNQIRYGQASNVGKSKQLKSQDEEDESFSDVRMQLVQLSTPPKNKLEKPYQSIQQDQAVSLNDQNTHLINSLTTSDKKQLLASQSLSSYQKEKDMQYLNYIPQEVEAIDEQNDTQNVYQINIRDKKSDTFTHLNNLDIKNPLIESQEYDQMQKQLEKEGRASGTLHKNDSNEQLKYSSNRNNQQNIQGYNQNSPQVPSQQEIQKTFQTPQNQKNIKKVHLKLEQKNKPQELSLQQYTPPQDKLEGDQYQYQKNNDNQQIQPSLDQDNSIQQYENNMYNELKRTLHDQASNNFTNFKVTPKGVPAIETSLMNNYTQKEKKKQKLSNLSGLSAKQLKNFDSPQVFKVDLSKKTTPKSDYFSQPKFQFYSPASKFNSRGFSSGTKGGINTSNTILNRDLASSIESQEGVDQFLTNNSANDVEVFYTQDEFLNNYSSADQNYRHNIYDQYKSHIRGCRSPSSYQTKKHKDLITLNVDFDGQDLEVKVYSDDTAFTIGERICMSLQKMITRSQMKNLAAIIQKRINDYTQSLQQIVEEIEDKKLKEKDAIDRYIRDRNLRENILNPLPQKQKMGLNDSKKDEIIGKLTVELNPNSKKQATIRIRENDDPYELAFSFINTYNIKKNKISFLVEKIGQIQNEYRVQQSLKEKTQRLSVQTAYNDVQQKSFKDIQGYYSAEQLSNLSPQNIYTPQNKISSSPINYNSQQIQEKGQTELFRVNLDKGNGDYIKIIVREGDNLKQLAYQVATDNQLNSNAYQKILKTLESAYKNFLENQWQAI
ncbi:Ras family protein (macronuclear) [Tetrahymena thermophila SB210]|uniref:Ras family protein n=1 Tax=Tetrahymena thermophila (strain SB210) TaxID=312017 RepID=I7M329_TETTS|nr:Ras family protein [Tetrahymena thermophila SB210]EAS02036.2 Ras family protein [Tetrahymena thermophila SB210]|eukprot:XP_001022281.2 Ras family protein [Tetrahymena thermophila SB210]